MKAILPHYDGILSINQRSHTIFAGMSEIRVILPHVMMLAPEPTNPRTYGSSVLRIYALPHRR